MTKAEISLAKCVINQGILENDQRKQEETRPPRDHIAHHQTQNELSLNLSDIEEVRSQQDDKTIMGDMGLN